MQAACSRYCAFSADTLGQAVFHAVKTILGPASYNGMEEEGEYMKYEEIREYLKRNPYCFRTTEEKENEFNLRIMQREGRKINFAKAAGRKFGSTEQNF